MSVVVFGSINMDLVARASRLPREGETLTGTTFMTSPGGKGANQAVACAKLGAETHMIGAVGDDVFAAQLIESMVGAGVRVDDVYIIRDASSGIAQITVDQQGKNAIVVIPGANMHAGRVGLSALTRQDKHRILLLQLEIELDAVIEATRLAHSKQMTVILDPAPAIPLPDTLLRWVDIITPNQTEAEILTGIAIRTVDDACRAGEILQRRGVGEVIIKMGEHGAVCVDAEGFRVYPAFTVEVVDTVAAGDAFNGGLAAALDRDLPFEQAMQWALAAGALSVTKPGAQIAMPYLDSLKYFLQLH
jgi:ribokinase